MNHTRSLFNPFGIFLILIVVAALTFFSCGNDQKKDDEVMDKVHNTNGDHMDEGQMSGKEIPMLGEEVVRKGEIDVEGIDKNKDGMVYQDMMDWNVISDEPGKCPLCKMTLKEVAVKEAEENLLKNDFKVKSN